MSNVLITGGSGLVGTALSSLLAEQGHSVKHLSRTRNLSAAFPAYEWNLNEGTADDEAFHGIDYIFHLAGANISDGKWTNDRKKIITDSRVKSGELLAKKVKELNIPLKAFIAASATGYYGSLTSEKIFNETDSAADDFLGTVCKKWEDSSLKFQDMNIRTVLLRTGVVLTLNGGALKKLHTPVKLGIATPIGSGKQYMPWIHIKDLCKLYLEVMNKDSFSGPYNAVSPKHIDNNTFIKKLAKSAKRPFWPLNVPSFIIHLLFGEMSTIILNGSRISSLMAVKQGFVFEYADLEMTFNDLI
tara:strand:- start:24423 stop:25325 length:903 start_codon:yes stop_codon:yes gene_type:complete